MAIRLPRRAIRLSQDSHKSPRGLLSSSLAPSQAAPPPSCSPTSAQQHRENVNPSTTHFGFETVPSSQKSERVGAVFSSVASSYDTMNDLMSFGIHRLWKDYFVRSLNPGTSSEKPWTILDIAGGTGDIAFRMLEHATKIKGDESSRIIISDINPDMLAEGRKRASQLPYGFDRLSFVEANAEELPTIEDNSIDLYTVAFGIRNFTNIPKALSTAHRVLKPGGVFACLEFSKVPYSLLNAVYKRWSFSAIPLIGQIVAGDRDSYQYLVESIERFPSQQEFARLIQEAGFLLPTADGREGWDNLTGGIAAIHKGIKPI